MYITFLESNIINDNEYLESLRKAIKERELGLGVFLFNL